MAHAHSPALVALNRSSDKAQPLLYVSTAKKPEHTAIQDTCTFCARSFAWSSWAHSRGHLTGDVLMALGASTTACTLVFVDVAAIFMAIAADGATVHGEPLVNYVAKIANVATPIHL